MKILAVKIKEKGAKNLEYNNKVNIEDFKQLALIFLDLESHGAKVERAFQEFREKKERGFPW
jgi:hypothetical protein